MGQTPEESGIELFKERKRANRKRRTCLYVLAVKKGVMESGPGRERRLLLLSVCWGCFERPLDLGRAECSKELVTGARDNARPWQWHIKDCLHAVVC